MSWELDTIHRESRRLSIEPLCISRYTFSMSREHYHCLGDLLTCLKEMLSCVGSLGPVVNFNHRINTLSTGKINSV
jgi:hypothetical protein